MAYYRQQQQQQQPFDPVPPGWHACPPIGEVSDIHHLIPMKVPLGNTVKFPRMLDRTNNHWCPAHVMQAAHEAITKKDPDGILGMVLDLSNSDKYYNPEEFTNNGIRYAKVPCRGRGQSPSALAANMAAWEIRKALNANPRFYILVHCTHGFNRSGFIIVSAAMRLLAEAGWCVERLFRRFAAQRPPGIYKHEYIDDLFRRHNEQRPPMARTPPLPAWKPADDEHEDGAEQLLSLPAQQSTRLSHSDKIGEAVPLEEGRFLLNTLYDIVQGQDNVLAGKGGPMPHKDILHRAPGDAVVGSQPVSLDRQNLVLLRMKRYFVTWKADGTRYLILLTRWGTYLVDRAGEVRRVHMRFPSRLPPPQDGRRPAHPVGPPHDFTLLDGEMVVDDVELDGGGQRRRLLIYDTMMVGGEGVSGLRFQDRYKLIEKEVVRPREEEKAFYLKHQVPNFRYDWALEPFSVRRKEFWPLDKAGSLLEKFIPKLCHESDGLIFQPWDDPYIPRTFPHLLKWKFPHMNSVDFKLFALPGRAPQLQLNCGNRRKRGTSEVNHMSLGDIGLGEQPVEFPDHVDPVKLNGRIVECAFDMGRRVWLYMRDRPDKTTANHRSVFEKVLTSISDNITEADILQVCSDALQSDIYGEEKLWQAGQHPSQLQQQQQQQQQQEYHQQHADPHQQQQHNGGGWAGEHHHLHHHQQQQQQQHVDDGGGFDDGPQVPAADGGGGGGFDDDGPGGPPGGGFGYLQEDDDADYEMAQEEVADEQEGAYQVTEAD